MAKQSIIGSLTQSWFICQVVFSNQFDFYVA